MLLMRPLLVGGLALLASAPEVHGQTQTLLFEDFENGLNGWTITNQIGGQWHLAPDSQCGAVTSMVAYNTATSCTYHLGPFNAGTLTSQAFVLAGRAPYTVSFDYMRSIASDGDTTCVEGRADGTGVWTALTCTELANDGALHHQSLPIPSSWAGHGIEIRFRFSANFSDNAFLGWLVDNVLVTNSGGWVDLGDAKAGSTGLPNLTGSGDLDATAQNELDLTNARPSSTAGLFFGLSQLSAPFKGGVMVPMPSVLVTMTTSATGTVGLPFTLGAGVPLGTGLYFQFWILDPGAALGLAASNGLEAVTN